MLHQEAPFVLTQVSTLSPNTPSSKGCTRYVLFTVFFFALNQGQALKLQAAKST